LKKATTKVGRREKVECEGGGNVKSALEGEKATIKDKPPISRKEKGTLLRYGSRQRIRMSDGTEEES